MYQVRMFYSSDDSCLVNKINKFFKENPHLKIINVSYSEMMCGYTPSSSAMVLYQEP